MKTATLNMRVDPSVKEEAERVYAQFGMNLTDAVNVFLHKSIMEGGLPFDLRQPRFNAETELAMQGVLPLPVTRPRHKRSRMSMMSEPQRGQRALVMTSQFKKDLKRARKRGLPIKELEAVIDLILTGEVLPPQRRDHLLTGDYAGFRECHIRPDWLLIYLDEPEICVVTAIRTGSHSDLFQ